MPFVLFAQDNIRVQTMRLEGLIYGLESGSVDTLAAIHPDSTGQFRVTNVGDPFFDLDAVNLRSMIYSLDTLSTTGWDSIRFSNSDYYLRAYVAGSVVDSTLISAAAADSVWYEITVYDSLFTSGEFALGNDSVNLYLYDSGSSEYFILSVTDNNSTMTLGTDSGIDLISMATDSFYLEAERIEFEGTPAIYYEDYRSLMTDSLHIPDIGKVGRMIKDSSKTYVNGLTERNDSVLLGDTLIENTFINTDDYLFSVGTFDIISEPEGASIFVGQQYGLSSAGILTISDNAAYGVLSDEQTNNAGLFYSPNDDTTFAFRVTEDKAVMYATSSSPVNYTFEINTDGIEVEGTTIDYMYDYSNIMDTTDRAIPDVAWVRSEINDSISGISGGGTEKTYVNGLFERNDSVLLGDTLIENTAIYTDSYDFKIESADISSFADGYGFGIEHSTGINLVGVDTGDDGFALAGITDGDVIFGRYSFSDADRLGYLSIENDSTAIGFITDDADEKRYLSLSDDGLILQVTNTSGEAAGFSISESMVFADESAERGVYYLDDDYHPNGLNRDKWIPHIKFIVDSLIQLSIDSTGIGNSKLYTVSLNGSNYITFSDSVGVGSDDQTLSIDSTGTGNSKKFTISIEDGNSITFTDSVGVGSDDQTLSIDSTDIAGGRQFTINIEDGNSINFVDSIGTGITYGDTVNVIATKYDIDTLSFVRTEIDPIYANDSTNIIWFSDTTLIATKYDIDSLSFIRTETDPIYTGDSANIIWFSDTTLIATKYDIDTIARHDAVTLTGTGDYLSLTGQQLTKSVIDTTSNYISGNWETYIENHTAAASIPDLDEVLTEGNTSTNDMAIGKSSSSGLTLEVESSDNNYAVSIYNSSHTLGQGLRVKAGGQATSEEILKLESYHGDNRFEVEGDGEIFAGNLDYSDNTYLLKYNSGTGEITYYDYEPAWTDWGSYLLPTDYLTDKVGIGNAPGNEMLSIAAYDSDMYGIVVQNCLVGAMFQGDSVDLIMADSGVLQFLQRGTAPDAPSNVQGRMYMNSSDDLPYWRNSSNTYSFDMTSTSDFWKKKDFREIINPLEKILSLNAYAFNWNMDYDEIPPNEEINLVLQNDNKKREAAGLVAQELEKIIPEVVKTFPDGYKAVDYDALVPYLIEAIKQLHEEIEILKNKK